VELCAFGCTTGLNGSGKAADARRTPPDLSIAKAQAALMACLRG
jgi:hypothetical protein